ncbi:MAG: hypothetical protein ACXVPU_03615 [Bacteroidia bacterium]
MKKVILICTIALSFAGCKKNYNCTCKDQTGAVVSVQTYKNTKGKAEEQCSQYYNSTYGAIPFNQTTCSIN